MLIYHRANLKLTRVLYGHGVNSNLTEMTKLNHFR